MPSRKKPFTGAQKKKQLQLKRERKRQDNEEYVSHDMDQNLDTYSIALSEDHNDNNTINSISKLNQQPSDMFRKYDPNKYKLHFHEESKEEIHRRKKLAMLPHEREVDEFIEVDIDRINSLESLLDMPKRPKWDYNMPKHVLLSREEKYFAKYVEGIFSKFGYENLSYFELNLETWRQLWRVVEMSDIILMISDIRYPAMHFSPALYNYVVNELNKPLILVLNKIDLVPASVVVSWKSFFETKYPHLHIVYFTSFPKDSNIVHKEDLKSAALAKRRIKKAFNPLGPNELLTKCDEIVGRNVDLTNWKQKIAEDANINFFSEGPEVIPTSDHHLDLKLEDHVPFKDGILTIGCCGYPNVGKSSLINSLMGHKVVSVSRTPGHTKHFQTIFLTNNVKLCDSPGLVFPSLVEKPLQILSGIYPIAQVREPYSAVQYIAKRIDLPKILGLERELAEISSTESAYDICDAWAIKKKYLTAKAGRPDTYRSANSILRLNLEGRIVFWTCPIGFSENKAFWKSHSDTAILTSILLNKSPDDVTLSADDKISSSEDSESESELSDTSGNEKYIKDKSEREISLFGSNPFEILSDE